MDIMNGNEQKPLVRDKFCINNTSVKTKQATGLGHRINASEINIKGGCETRRKKNNNSSNLKEARKSEGVSAFVTNISDTEAAKYWEL